MNPYLFEQISVFTCDPQIRRRLLLLDLKYDVVFALDVNCGKSSGLSVNPGSCSVIRVIDDGPCFRTNSLRRAEHAEMDRDGERVREQQQSLLRSKIAPRTSGLALL